MENDATTVWTARVPSSPRLKLTSFGREIHPSGMWQRVCTRRIDARRAAILVVLVWSLGESVRVCHAPTRLVNVQPLAFVRVAPMAPLFFLVWLFDATDKLHELPVRTPDELDAVTISVHLKAVLAVVSAGVVEGAITA